jgi:hypothetical protein
MSDWQETYIEELRASGMEATARARAHVGRATVERAMEEDVDFASTVLDAKERWADVLRKEAYRRAVEGIDKGVYYQGVLTATEKQYSDSLLSSMLKAHCPEYAPELTLKGDKNKPLTINIRGFTEVEEDLA